jgi:hypothetical protein
MEPVSLATAVAPVVTKISGQLLDAYKYRTGLNHQRYMADLEHATRTAERAHGASGSALRGSKEARALARDAASLAEQIKGLPGYHRRIWDIAPSGTIFDSSAHLPWHGRMEEGAVDFGVIPSYLVDLPVIARRQVFTSWA